jgi:hypothetical protein
MIAVRMLDLKSMLKRLKALTAVAISIHDMNLYVVDANWSGLS